MKTLLIFALFTLSMAAKEPVAPSMVTAAEKFLATLDPAQKSRAALSFTGEERENFHYIPRDRAGLPLKEMTASQREAVMALLDSALSQAGKLKVTQIMTLEGILAETEKNPTYRDPGKYCLTIFGTPGDAKGWGWRFEGHHLSLNLTFVGDKVSVTPAFLGTNPAEVRAGKYQGLRPLAAEEDLARALVAQLIATGKSAVIFSEKPPAEILTAAARTATALEPVGIPAADMNDVQQTALLSLISQYTGRYRPELAASDMAKIRAADIAKIRFGWAGGTNPGEAYYYRIQGPTFLMEAANVQNHANHLHTTWRDFNGDFGRDLLREHVEKEH
ncbi:MAG TPA: DUF3500 domain-containing protein [Luteolibacter sp.]